jgi:hypothetical protein
LKRFVIQIPVGQTRPDSVPISVDFEACVKFAMPPIQYSLISLPQRIFDEDPLPSLSATISRENGEVVAFSIPDFKIGTLDALVQQADDLTKLNTGCESVVGKVADSLKSLLDGDEDKAFEQKLVNDSEPGPPPNSVASSASCVRAPSHGR